MLLKVSKIRKCKKRYNEQKYINNNDNIHSKTRRLKKFEDTKDERSLSNIDGREKQRFLGKFSTISKKMSIDQSPSAF